jgi:hypothetical protein
LPLRREDIEALIAAGWSPVPILKGRKNPIDPDWQNKTYAPEHFPEDANVGVHCGEKSGWRVDVDLDGKEAIAVARELLPDTGLVHGRPGKPLSHRWYRAEKAETKQFTDLNGVMLVELRSNGGQTVVPPSTHQSGEAITWVEQRSPLTIDAPVLLHHVRAVAIAALLAQNWPTGGRHAASGPLAGFLLRVGFEEALVVRIIEQAARAAGDDEVKDRVRVAEDTCRNHAAGKKTTGAPRLAELMPRGAEIVKKVYQWMEREGDDALEQLNEIHFVAQLGSDTVVGTERDNGRPPTFSSFEQFRLRYYNRFIGKKKLGEFWLEHRHRRTYREVVFAPPPLTCQEDDYNLWTGFTVEPDPNPVPEDRCPRFLDHLWRVICNGDADIFNYLLDHLALIVQRPGDIKATGIAVVMRGDAGAGKGTFVELFGSLFGVGRHYIQVDKQKHLTGAFNDHLSGKVVVFADEAVWAGDKRDIGALRRLVTERYVTVERKFKDAVTEQNCIHLFMATNEDWVWPASVKERRGFILDIHKQVHTNQAYFNAIYDEWDAGGAQAFLAFCQQRYVPNNRLGPIPSTAALEHQQNLSFDPVLMWWKEKLYKGELGLDGWPEFVSSDWLHTNYIEAMQFLGITRRVGEIELLMRMKTLLPKGTKQERRRVMVNTAKFGPPNPVNLMRRGIALPPLQACRESFDKHVGHPAQWPEDEPGIQPRLTEELS